MTLVHTPSTAVPGAIVARRGASLRYPVTLVCAASAGVHAALVPDHLQESTLLGVAFVVSAAALALVAVAARTPRNDAWAPAAAAVVLLATAVAYLLSRTTGIPVLLAGPEPVDPVGVLTSSAEVLAAGAALLLHTRRDAS